MARSLRLLIFDSYRAQSKLELDDEMIEAECQLKAFRRQQTSCELSENWLGELSIVPNQKLLRWCLPTQSIEHIHMRSRNYRPRAWTLSERLCIIWLWASTDLFKRICEDKRAVLRIASHRWRILGWATFLWWKFCSKFLQRLSFLHQHASHKLGKTSTRGRKNFLSLVNFHSRRNEQLFHSSQRTQKFFTAPDNTKDPRSDTQKNRTSRTFQPKCSRMNEALSRLVAEIYIFPQAFHVRNSLTLSLFRLPGCYSRKQSVHSMWALLVRFN